MFVKLPVKKEPDKFLLPDQPFTPPLPEHEVALSEFQVIVLDPLKETLDGLAKICTVGFCT